VIAFEAWGLLSNGMGGLDWSGLEAVVALLGIADVEGLINRLKTIKLHRPPTVDQEE
jgi:hypothetical protein